MNFTKEKFDLIIDKLINEKLTGDELINHLNKYRLKFYNDSRGLSECDILADLSLNTNSPSKVAPNFLFNPNLNQTKQAFI